MKFLSKLTSARATVLAFVVAAVAVAATGLTVAIAYKNDQILLAYRQESAARDVELKISDQLLRLNGMMATIRMFYSASLTVDAEEFTIMAGGVTDQTDANQEPIQFGLGYLNLGSRAEQSLLFESGRGTRPLDEDGAKSLAIGRAIAESPEVFLDYDWGGVVDWASVADDAFILNLALPVFEESDPGDKKQSNILDTSGRGYRGIVLGAIDLNALARTIAAQMNADLVSLEIERNDTVSQLLPQLFAPEDVYKFSFDINNIRFNAGLIIRFEGSESTFIERQSSFFAIISIAVVIVLLFIYFTEKERRRAVRETAAANGISFQKSRFLATMSHEFRTPINGILGMSSLISKEDLSNSQTKYLHTLNRSAQSLLAIINDILDLSKVEAGKLDYDPTEIDLGEVIDLCMQAACVTSAPKNIELSLNFPLDVPRQVVADALRIQQIIGNLLSNAIKFTEKGEVTLHLAYAAGAEQDRGELTITCEDTGVGIPKEKQDEIFCAFTQADISTTRNYGGTGLGLAIVREITSIMGGSVRLESEVAVGSKFIVTVPVSMGRPKTRDRNLVTVVNLGYLVIGSSKAWEARAIEGLGAVVVFAASLEEGLALSGPTGVAHEFDFTLIEDTIGEAAENVLTSLPGTKVLIRSSTQASAPRDVAAESGFSGVLNRPILPEHFIARVAGLHRTTLKAQPALDGPVAVKATPAQSNHHVLLVEDDPTNQMYAEALLENLGCSFETADNGKQAIEKLQNSGRFDLVLMDCQMPVMDGFEAARQITKMISRNEIASLPIIALTANALRGDQEKCLDAGMVDFASKPISEITMAALLDRYPSQNSTLLLETKDQTEAPSISLEIGPPTSAESDVLTKVDKVLPEGESAKDPVSGGVGESIEVQKESLLDAAALNSTRATLGDRFNRLVEIFIATEAEHTSSLERAAASRSFKECVRIAHTIKSTSKLVGAMSLSISAGNLEEMLKKKSSDNIEINASVSSVNKLYGMVVVELKKIQVSWVRQETAR